jgi:hypothetical protein
MRNVVITTILLAGLCTASAHALETAAGTDSVNASQIGINAKVEALNNISKAGIDQINKCGWDGKVYDSKHNVCVTITETDPVAMPKVEDLTTKVNAINTCGNGNKFYHTDGTCSPIDINATLTSIFTCSKSGKFWNGTSCVAPTSSDTPQLVAAGGKLVQTTGSNQTKSGTVSGPQLCVVNNDGRYGNGKGNCSVSGSPGGTWTVKATSQDGTNIQCQMACYNFK